MAEYWGYILYVKNYELQNNTNLFHRIFPRYIIDRHIRLITKSSTHTNNYHLFTETEGNSVFCGPETAVVARGEAEGNNGGRGATKHTAFPRSQ
jgi:hypothetical protein